MKIGELAKQGKVKVGTLRFYERRGLLPSPIRTDAGYRQYSADDLRRLRFIQQAKSFGFSLREIKEVLRARGRNECPCTDVVAIAEEHLSETNEQIAKLSLFRTELSKALRIWKRTKPSKLSPGALCILIERTMDTGLEQ
ncbi:MAG: heavy metal-responsive transcriptional regulator [Candidatus Koribacter versatilis]|uniref:Heavy metal-responsive transcriptional regulator n=1 Tax=Candidatus Korobacter versatilis TaxID=658062 RepID=A0A932EMZ4_9BACT|nr:heavy metal-responsive transcriptional regulator [Candidatus Koribacter versatilis]